MGQIYLCTLQVKLEKSDTVYMFSICDMVVSICLKNINVICFNSNLDVINSFNVFIVGNMNTIMSFVENYKGGGLNSFTFF